MNEWTPAELVSQVQGEFAAYLGLEPAQVDPELPIDQLGLDSLTAAQLAVDIEDRLGVSLFLTDLSSRKTIAELAASVLAEPQP
jgi:acyl carrier protein